MVTEAVNSLRRRVRLVMLLSAAERTGLAPIGILRLHSFAYLSNVLSPVWNLPPLDGKILKRRGGPFYPELQNDLDRLVGMGVAVISGVGHVRDEAGRWRLEGSYNLNHEFAEPILSTLGLFKEESRLCAFILELGHALTALSDDELDGAVSEDATYSDPLTSNDNVVDFEAKRSRNFSANAAEYFDQVMPVGIASPGEKLHLYVRHLRRRIDDQR
ncbi:MAG: hypothetical protein GY791_01890 [Alphaproteobacteria bacterium]|nr:hypothetical protein [Alphaproteobacteria bacterium]